MSSGFKLEPIFKVTIGTSETEKETSFSLRFSLEFYFLVYVEWNRKCNANWIFILCQIKQKKILPFDTIKVNLKNYYKSIMILFLLDCIGIFLAIKDKDLLKWIMFRY